MWLDYRQNLQPLFEGGQNAIGQAMWVVLRIMRLGEYSSYWNSVTHEAVGGSKWNYDDYRVRVIWIPGASIKNDENGSAVVLNTGVDNTDVKVFAVQFKDLIRPGNDRILCSDDLLFEIDKAAGMTPPEPPLKAISRYRIADCIPVTGDNGQNELFYIVARRTHGES